MALAPAFAKMIKILVKEPHTSKESKDTACYWIHLNGVLQRRVACIDIQFDDSIIIIFYFFENYVEDAKLGYV
ncbi:unnamed protein product [Dovyalis caffra]|uniref:Uncharacterized protein n=1 Tax=Dovyalis caffra TaxID=77055 RepID=A0AAV1SHQ9_9ROSI|nr:unnamed protein product [Dovyalis caffra]